MLLSKETLFITGSLLVFPASWIFIHFALLNPSWCLSDECILGRINNSMDQLLAVFYAFLLVSGIVAFLATKSASLRRVFNRPIGWWSLSLGELLWIFGSLFLVIVVVPSIMWPFRWNSRVASGYLKKNPWIRLVYACALNVTGDCMSVLLGFILLPAAKHSVLATALQLPYTSLFRTHIVHGWSIFVLVLLHLLVAMLEVLVTPGKGWEDVRARLFVIDDYKYGHENYMVIIGFTSAVILLVVVLTSLVYVRRRYFNIFYFSHFLVFAFLLGAYIHASSCIYFLLPGLLLYSIDGCTRLRSSLQKDRVLSVIIEESGYITVTVSTSKAASAKPGQFMRVNFPAVSRVEFHPWTLVRSDAQEATFMFAPNAKTNEWSTRVAELLYSWKKGNAGPSVHLQGPFGKETALCSPDVLNSSDMMLFYVAGTGVAASVAALRHILASRPDLRVRVCWVSRTEEMARLSHLREWLSNTTAVSVELYSTRPPADAHEFITADGDALACADKAEDPLLLGTGVTTRHGRPKLGDVLQRAVLPMAETREEAVRVAVFVCGPLQFTKDAVREASLFGRSHATCVTVQLDTESFAL